MTLEEIKKLFNEIFDTHEEVLEIFMELAKHKEEYNNSEFAKTTGLSIFEAFEMYYKTSLTYYTMFDMIQKIIDNLDYTQLNDNLSLDNLFDQIPTEFASVLKDIIQLEK